MIANTQIREARGVSHELNKKVGTSLKLDFVASRLASAGPLWVMLFVEDNPFFMSEVEGVVDLDDSGSSSRSSNSI